MLKLLLIDVVVVVSSCFEMFLALVSRLDNISFEVNFILMTFCHLRFDLQLLFFVQAILQCIERSSDYAVMLWPKMHLRVSSYLL